jgi:hypothetical protein
MAGTVTVCPYSAEVVVVTSTLIAPVIPSTTGHLRASGSRPSGVSPRDHLPVPDLTTPSARSVVYGLAILDCNGRIADNNLLRALGWDTQTRLDIREQGGLLLVTATAQGVFALTRQGHLRLPAPAPRWCSLGTGDRVLLAAEPDQGRLVVHPPAALDAMVGWLHGFALGGVRA